MGPLPNVLEVINNNDNIPAEDGFHIIAPGVVSGTLGGLALGQIRLDLIDKSGLAFAGDALPTALILSAFVDLPGDGACLMVSCGRKIGISGASLVEGHITSLELASAVPEPSTLGLIGLGLLGLGAMKRRRSFL